MVEPIGGRQVDEQTSDVYGDAATAAAAAAADNDELKRASVSRPVTLRHRPLIKPA